MKKCIGVLAHVDAGKTTFCEQILYHTKCIRSRGRVDHKNSFLDSHNIEKERGITIFSDQAIFDINNNRYYLIDTPGHIDFSSEMERAISIMDYAILIISGVEGVQAHTETVWNLLREYNVPTIFFINKLDRTGASLNNVISEIQRDLTIDICNIDNNNIMNEELVEFISERNEEFMEKYFNDEYEETSWKNEFKKQIKECKAFPCFSGSALQDEGIIEFLENFNELTYTEYKTSTNFSGRVYKIGHDNNGTRQTFIKALSGTLKVRDELIIKVEDNVIREKISSMKLCNGTKFITVDNIEAGDVFVVTGISNLNAGDGIGTLEDKIILNTVPTLMSSVILNEKYSIKDILGYFRILEAEDPSLKINFNEINQEISINIMGKIQLEILKEVVQERFNINIDFGPCEIMYKETINNSIRGYGHFEPLKHYAEVHLQIESMPRGSGITFENKCHADHMTTGNQNLVRTHIFEKEHKGILTGSPITDVKISLLTGRAHNKHTEGGDFREATLRALRQGLEKADNILLEPYYKFKIGVELDYMGRVLSDIQKMKGEFNPPETNLNKVTITGIAPVATFMDYSMELIAFTKGKGTISQVFHGYDICHNTEEVIEKIAYNKDADIEYSSNSVFCSKGQGYIVKWDEAESYMHCER